MMRYALCLHQNGEAIQALDAYKELRKLHSNYAFPLTNIAYIYLRNGSPWKTIEVLEQYFNEVGEGHPSPLTNMIDEDSLIFGSPCNIKSIFREDCVAALNLLGVAQSNVHNHTRAMDAYSSAIEIGQGTAAVSDVFTNLGTLQYELGENVLARDSFLSAFLTQSGFIDPGPLIQCETVVPSVPISLEDSSRALQTFHSSLDALEVLIGQGGAGIRQEDYFRFLDKGQIETIQALPVSAAAMNRGSYVPFRKLIRLFRLCSASLFGNQRVFLMRSITFTFISTAFMIDMPWKEYLLS
jgi:tetratricopeptide (TPR) repeat protein